MANDVNAPQDENAVEAYIASLDDEQTVRDTRVLIELMQRVSGHHPKLWNVGTIGFDTNTTNTTPGARATQCP